MLFSHKFEGIGTHWNIDIDTPQATDLTSLWLGIENEVDSFNSRFSRFKENSLVNQFKGKKAGQYQIDPEFFALLDFAKSIKLDTNGKFDPAIGQLISATGYDSNYTFKPDLNKIDKLTIPAWETKEENTLIIDGPICFDLGGFAKGYLIDKVSSYITNAGFEYHLVDAGGDIYGTTKSDLTPWNIAIEFPNDSTKVIGSVKLNHQALAVSDIFKRNWGHWHHILDPQTKKPLIDFISCCTLSSNAITSDALTTAIMLTDQNTRQKLSEKYKTEFLLINNQYQPTISNNWPGEIF